MGMTAVQAKQFGKFIAQARMRKGLSVRGLSRELGLSTPWCSKLETGGILEPAPDRLALVADRLGIEPSQIDRYTGGSMSYGLPEPRVYFRAKLGLTADEAAQVQAYIDKLRRAA